MKVKVTFSRVVYYNHIEEIEASSKEEASDFAEEILTDGVEFTEDDIVDSSSWVKE
jgi:hypothetical protein